MAYSTDSKTQLLPTTTINGADEAQRLATQNHRHILIELTIQCINLVLSCFQFVILCVFASSKPRHNNRYYEHVSLLAHGFLVSMPIAAPTTVVLSIAIPYISQPVYKRVARDLVVCCYLVSTLLGALQVGSSH